MPPPDTKEISREWLPAQYCAATVCLKQPLLMALGTPCIATRCNTTPRFSAAGTDRPRTHTGQYFKVSLSSSLSLTICAIAHFALTTPVWFVFRSPLPVSSTQSLFVSHSPAKISRCSLAQCRCVAAEKHCTQTCFDTKLSKCNLISYDVNHWVGSVIEHTAFPNSTYKTRHIYGITLC